MDYFTKYAYQLNYFKHAIGGFEEFRIKTNIFACHDYYLTIKKI